MLTVLIAVTLQLPPATGSLPAGLEAARQACRASGEWPELPATVEGCAIEWSSRESVVARFREPSKKIEPRLATPTLPADEEVEPESLLLEYLVSPAGNVEQVCILRSVSPSVDQYYVDRALRTVFEPASQCGVPVPHSVIMSVDHHAWNWPRTPPGDSPPNQALQGSRNRELIPSRLLGRCSAGNGEERR